MALDSHDLQLQVGLGGSVLEVVLGPMNPVDCQFERLNKLDRETPQGSAWRKPVTLLLSGDVGVSGPVPGDSCWSPQFSLDRKQRELNREQVFIKMKPSDIEQHFILSLKERKEREKRNKSLFQMCDVETIRLCLSSGST